LPWTADALNFGFGPAGGQPAHLPQPSWMGEFAVDAEEARPGSTLAMYRQALKLRRELQTREDMTWVDSGTENVASEVLHFKRDGGWEVIMNFEGESVRVPRDETGGQAEVLVVSSEEGLGEGMEIPKNTTVWFRR
jgi:alpha-glucosidase